MVCLFCVIAVRGGRVCKTATPFPYHLIRDMEALERLAGNSRMAESAPETKSRAFPMCRPAPLKPSPAAGCATTGINRMPTIPSVTRPETRVAHYNATRSSLRNQMMGAKVKERKL